MKTVVWASMQSLGVLERIDLMLPSLIDEDDVEGFYGKRISRGSRSIRSNPQRKGRAALGVALVGIGIAMLIPGPIDFILLGAGTVVGSYIGAPWLGAVLVAAYNIIAIAMIVVGGILILSSLL